MKVRSVPRPDGKPCSCGHVMTPGRRYEATRTLDVSICWQCGAEDPPLYRRPVVHRRHCRWCGDAFFADDDRKACSEGCELALGLYRRSRRSA